MDLRALHRAMLDPATYPDGDEPIEFLETHVSRLYLTQHYVYKIKKPVNFGFLDFTTLAKREFFCHEEVRLNQRFAPDTYLGVLPLNRTTAGLRLAGRGKTIEFVVHMRRLPAEQMLDHRLMQSDPALPAEMERLGRYLASLHQAAPVCRDEKDFSHLATIRGNWQENFCQAASFTNITLSERALALLTDYVSRFLERRAPLLRERERNGFVRDGHGDLHAEHVCLTDPIRVYDCIEFNRRFRVADTAADLAFLLMDLDFRRRRELAARLREVYLSYYPDPDFDRLLPFYKIYRAFVRGKVESFLALAPEASAETRDKAQALAMDYFNLALGGLTPPMLVLIGGLMGSGKSTVGAALAAALGGALLSSDRLRKELAGNLAASGREADFGSGIYSADFSRLTYEQLLRKCRALLAEGATVIADASFLRREERDRFRRAGAEIGMPVLTVVTACARETALVRLDRRQAAGNDPSDGRRELYDLQAAAFEALGTDEDAIVIDTCQSVSYNVQSLLCAIIARVGCADEPA